MVGLSEHWKLLAGLRGDRFRSTLDNLRTGATARQDRDAWSPRVGLTWLATPALSAYASWSRSFRPNAGSDVAARAFSPETARAHEAGLKWQAADGLAGATLAVFDITKRNVLTADPANPGYSITAGEVRSSGVELDFGGKRGRQWRLSGSAGYTDARITRDNTLAAGTRLVNVPRTTASLLAVHEGAAWGAGGGVNDVGERTGDQAGSLELPGYTTARALAWWQATLAARLSLNVDNLFDRRHASSSYSSLSIMPGTGRTARLSLHMKF